MKVFAIASIPSNVALEDSPAPEHLIISIDLDRIVLS